MVGPAGTFGHASVDYAVSNWEQTGVFRPWPTAFVMRMSKLQAADGTSNTLMFAEKRWPYKNNDYYWDDNEGYAQGWDDDWVRLHRFRRSPIFPAPTTARCISAPGMREASWPSSAMAACK